MGVTIAPAAGQGQRRTRGNSAPPCMAGHEDVTNPRQMAQESGSVRLAEVLGGLSLACDLADGFPPEKVLRTAVLAVELGRRLDLDAAVLRDAFYASILRYTGCTAFSHEEAHLFGAGDDIGTRSVMALADVSQPGRFLGGVVTGLARAGSPLQRARAVGAMLSD